MFLITVSSYHYSLKIDIETRYKAMEDRANYVEQQLAAVTAEQESTTTGSTVSLLNAFIKFCVYMKHCVTIIRKGSRTISGKDHFNILLSTVRVHSFLSVNDSIPDAL